MQTNCVLNKECGISNREARLLGGEELRTHEFPWMSAIQIENKKIQVPATLINNRYVITAASNLIGYIEGSFIALLLNWLKF